MLIFVNDRWTDLTIEYS